MKNHHQNIPPGSRDMIIEKALRVKKALLFAITNSAVWVMVKDVSREMMEYCLSDYAIIVALIDQVAWPICIELAGQLG